MKVTRAGIIPLPGYRTIGMINRGQKMHLFKEFPLGYTLACKSNSSRYWREFHYWYTLTAGEEITCKHCLRIIDD